MHVFIITLIFSIVFSFLSFNRPIQITTFLKISLFSFCIRIAIALISFILLTGSLNLFSSENVEATSIMFIVALYLFSFYVYSKVVLKNFLRVGEVFARFSLDALPGEQMSIESGKRDGIISISEAQSKRSETISNSLKYTSFETVLRLLSSEPVIISMLVVIGVLFGVFDYRTTGDLLKFKLNIVNTLFAGSLILISGFLSLMPISKFTFGSKINEGGSIRLNLSYFYFEIMTYSSITTFLVSVVALAFSVLTNSLGGGRTSFYFLMLAGGIGSLLSLKFRKKSSGSFLILENEFNGVDTFEFNSSDQLLFDHKKGDLVISIFSDSRDVEKNQFLTDLLKSLVEMESLFIAVKRVVLQSHRSNGSADTIEYQWEGENYRIKLGFQNENRVLLAKNYFLEVLSKKLATSIKTSDVIKKLNEEYYRNSSLSFISGFDYSNFEFITKCISGMHTRGLVVNNLISMVEFAMSHLEELDESAAISDYLNSNSSVFSGLDGICRVIYLDNFNDSSRIPSVVASLKSRNVSPIILVVNEDDEETNLTQIGSLYQIEKDLLPSNIDFFPLPPN